MHNFVVLDLFVFPSIAPWFVLCSHYRLSYGGTRLWREYLNVISVDKRLNLLRKFKGMSSQNCPKTNERLEPCLTSVVSCWRIPIFPGRLQPSIFGTTELNFCVRNGNRWTLCVNLTNFLLHLQFPAACNCNRGTLLLSGCTFRDSNPGPTD